MYDTKYIQNNEHRPVRNLNQVLIRCYLNTDNAGRSLKFLGNRLHNFGPMYLMECFPCVVVLNLGMANSLFLNEYLVFVIWKRSAIYFGLNVVFVLYIRTAISCHQDIFLIVQTSFVYFLLVI